MIRSVISVAYTPIRFFQILFTVLYGIAIYLIRSGKFRKDPRSLGEFYQGLLQNLGGTFIKAGQALSLRFDILPLEHCEALAGLLDRVKPFSAAKGHRIIERDLKKPVSELFLSITPEPIASASFSQVYKAILPDGNPIAVKVKRPGMHAKVFADTTFLHLARWMVIITGIGHRMGAASVLKEISEILINELDYSREARFLYMMKQISRKIPNLVVPGTYPEYSSHRILSMDFLEGPSFRDLMTAKREGQLSEMSDSSGNRINTAEACNHLFQIIFRSIFELGFFHADPHAGNVIVLPGGMIGLIDFGIVGILDKEMRRKNLEYLGALVNGDATGAAALYAGILVAGLHSDRESLIRDVSMELMLYISTASDPRLPIAERSSARLYLRSIALARKYRFALPRNVLLYYKSVFTADNMMIALCPEYDSREQTILYLSGYMNRRLKDEMGFEQFLSRSSKLLDTVSRMPENLDALLELAARQSSRSKREVSTVDAVLDLFSRPVAALLWFGVAALPFTKYVLKADFLSGLDLTGTVLLCSAMVLLGLRIRA